MKSYKHFTLSERNCLQQYLQSEIVYNNICQKGKVIEKLLSY